MAVEFVAKSAIAAEKVLLEQELTNGQQLVNDVGIKAITHFGAANRLTFLAIW
ncbi:MAG: hypothetical protein H7240_04890 [Glaciimonas sp.]|nr:hypothetical protein [Glaciimonas sp.]